MPVRSSRHLPALAHLDEERPGDRQSRDVLRREPDGGEHWWVRLAATGLSNRQVIDALARAAGIPAEAVGEAGGRDRRARTERWLSVPAAEVEHPKRLRNAGYQRKLKVLEVKAARRPVTPDEVVAVTWRVVLRGAGRDGGYLRARRILDHLRREGFVNYLTQDPGGKRARLGRLIAQGRPLPPTVQAPGGARGLLSAYRNQLFNRYAAERCADGTLGVALAGEVLEVHANRPPHQRALEVVADPGLAQARVEAWEAIPLGPLFGHGMACAEDDAAAREEALLADQGVALAAFAPIAGGRRALRLRPAAAQVDLVGEDLVLDCKLPPDAYLDALIAEFVDRSAGDEGEGEGEGKGEDDGKGAGG